MHCGLPAIPVARPTQLPYEVGRSTVRERRAQQRDPALQGILKPAPDRRWCGCLFSRPDTHRSECALGFTQRAPRWHRRQDHRNGVRLAHSQSRSSWTLGPRRRSGPDSRALQQYPHVFHAVCDRRRVRGSRRRRASRPQGRWALGDCRSLSALLLSLSSRREVLTVPTHELAIACT